MRYSMRRVVAGLVVAVALLLPACSDQPTEVTPTAPADVAPPTAALVEGCPTITLAGLLTQINQLLPRGPFRTSVIALVSALPLKFQQRIQTAIRRRIFPIVDLILRAYDAGRFGAKTPAKQESVFKLIRDLYCYVGLAPPDLPSGSGGTDVAVAVVFPNSPTTTVVVPSEHAAVTVPTGAAPTGGVTIVVRLLDEASPLRTSLDQYPLFYHFSGTTATGPVTFNLDVLAGICPEQNLNEIDATLRLAHNVGPNFGDVEVLPRPEPEVAVPGLDCANLPLVSGSNGGSGQGVFAWGAWSRMSRGLEPLARALLPEPLHAATLALLTIGVGGTTKKFSEFGIVDVFSNPGSFAPIGPTESTAEGGNTVTRTVRVTSDNGSPIPNVPVTFTTEEDNGEVVTPQPVLSNADGEASVSWALPEGSGTFTLHAAAPDEDNDPAETTDPPGAPLFNLISTPDVAFTPQSLTFRATVPGGIDYQATGWRYLVSSTSGVFPLSITDFDEAGYDDSGWSTGNAGFGEDGGNECPLNQDAQATEWPIGTQILLRKPFTGPAGAGSVEVKVAIDNDIQVFVNGANVTGTGGEPDESGFLIHDGCPTLDSFTFTAPVTSGVNWLAIRGRDRGGSSYVDAKVVPVIEEGGE